MDTKTKKQFSRHTARRAQKNISEKALENAELIPEEYENRLTDSVAPDKKERKNSRFRRKKKKMSKWGEWENL